MIRISVGKVVKSVGLGIYKEIRIISTEIEIDTVKKKSKIPLGSGTIMIASIAIIKATTVKSLALTIGSIYGATNESISRFFFANECLLCSSYIF